MKKIAITCLSLLATLCVSTACESLPVSLPLDFLGDKESQESVSSSKYSDSDSVENSSVNSVEESVEDSSQDSSVEDSSVKEPSQAEQILTMAYALESGETLGVYQLTGVVSKVAWTDKGDSCLTIIVEGFTDMPMYCYWLQDSDFVEVGYTITVSGTIKNYQGTVEFDHPDLVSWQAPGGNSGSGNANGGASSSHTYTDFTASEKQALTSFFGSVIPFLANDTYYLEEYTYTRDDGDEEEGYNFYTYGNTSAEYNAYKALFNESNGYTFYESYQDEYYDTWYTYQKDDFYVDFSYYQTEDGDYVMDLYVYFLSSSGTGGSSSQNTDLITNAGKGLPTSASGVYNVDFTKAKYVKDVTEQGYYLDGCPTTGSPKVLVVPLQFSDVTAQSEGYDINDIKKAFNGSSGQTDYYSVRDYYYISSYGQLDVDFTVLDSWFTPKYASSYYAEYTITYYGSEVEGGDQLIMHELLTSLEKTMDLSEFDSDNNGTIDAIVFINTLEIDSDTIFQWAYRYWNIFTDDDGDAYTYDGVYANDYMWAPYKFIWESYDSKGNTVYDSSVINTYTYIHEFGHILGADDYYDTSYSGNHPMDGYDMMDAMLGDHNPYSKFNYGWLTSSRLIVAQSSVTVQLEAFSKNGDSLIVASDWDDELGVYQEYYVIVYYTNEGLNSGDGGYFSRDGILVYHVNASLYKEVQGSYTYYDVYNNNTDPVDDYGTKDNLIEFVKSTANEFTYIQGSSISANTTDTKGKKIPYTFTVDSLSGDIATLTFTKNG